MIGSIRTREVERKPYMQKPRDWLEGMKHSSTAQTMRHLRVEVMELCEGAGLYQIDLLNGLKEHVSEAEYWARRRGQLKLDRENAALLAAGQQPRQKKFETVKDTLRKQISSVLYRATSFEDFRTGSCNSTKSPSRKAVGGMIRRHPKGMDFTKVTAEEIAATENWTNSCLRRILGYKSAGSAF